jgi:DeoR/GlpR family transcriptional regulator of sugar metabolism
MTPPPIPAERLERIQQLVSQRGIVSLRSAMHELGVSQMTVRRDFAALEEMGVVRRTHGGIVGTDQALPYVERQGLEHAAKDAIGAAAAAFVEEGDTILLGAGTTCLALAQALAGRSGVTVVTNSAAAIPVLRRNPALNLIATGGSVSASGNDMTGPLAEASLRQIRAGKAFVGAHGVAPEGMYAASLERAVIDRLMIEASAQAFLLADRTKLGSGALALVAGLDRVAWLVTDEVPSAATQAWLNAADVQVLAATVGDHAYEQGHPPLRQSTHQEAAI